MKSQVSQTQRHQVTENITTIRLQRENKIKVITMMPNARETTQHGSPPGWLEENVGHARQIFSYKWGAAGRGE
jgi:hypothetical protein